MSTKRRYELRARAEKAAATRRRITEATVALHQEVGPARTTVAEIARRAGVQRLTVYNHFPDERELFGACQAHWLHLHPPPAFDALLAVRDPGERLAGLLEALYAWYRETAPMTEKVTRDAAAVPALAEAMAGQAAAMEQVVAALAAGWGARGRRARAVRAALGLALEFGTWRSLSAAGLSDREAALVMVGAVSTSAR